MSIELHLSRDFRNKMGGITQSLAENNQPALVYNEMVPTRSFFVLPREMYIGLLELADRSEEAGELEELLAKLDANLIKKYKSMIRKRYEKN